MQKTGTTAQKKKRLLIVEDNPLIRKLTEKVLSDFDLDIYLAGNGRVAVEMSRQMFFDIILMDIQMPVMDGVEAIRRIRRDEQASGMQSKIFVLSSFERELILDECLAAGANHFINKPLEREDIHHILQ